MVDHQGGLGERTVRRADRSGEVAQTNRMDLQHGPHADGPHGRQGPADSAKDPQPDALPLGGDARTSTARRAALRAAERVQRRADADDAVPPGNRRTERQRTRRAGSIDQREKEKGRKEMTNPCGNPGIAGRARYATALGRQGVEYLNLEDRCPRPDVAAAEHPTPNIQRPTSNISNVPLRVGCWMFDVG